MPNEFYEETQLFGWTCMNMARFDAFPLERNSLSAAMTSALEGRESNSGLLTYFSAHVPFLSCTSEFVFTSLIVSRDQTQCYDCCCWNKILPPTNQSIIDIDLNTKRENVYATFLSQHRIRFLHFASTLCRLTVSCNIYGAQGTITKFAKTWIGK